jgi:ABC-2 type transport system permease protein
MNRILLKKSILESRGLLLGCMAALFVVGWTRVWLVSRFDMSRFRLILEQLREFERFFAVPFEQLFTYAGRIALTFDEPVVLVCVCVWAIARGSDCVSGELGRGTLEMLLAQPVSRWRLFWSQALVTIGGLALVCLSVWLGIYVGIATTSVQEALPAPGLTIPLFGIEVPNLLAPRRLHWVPLATRVDPAVFAPAVLNLFSLGLLVAGISSLFSSGQRYRSRTIGVVAGLTIAQMLLRLLALASDRFAWTAHLTFFTAYEPEAFVGAALQSPSAAWSWVRYAADGRFLAWGPLTYDLLLAGLGLACFVAGTVVFQRRDLPAPL